MDGRIAVLRFARSAALRYRPVRNFASSRPHFDANEASSSTATSNNAAPAGDDMTSPAGPSGQKEHSVDLLDQILAEFDQEPSASQTDEQQKFAEDDDRSPGSFGAYDPSSSSSSSSSPWSAAGLETFTSPSSSSSSRPASDPMAERTTTSPRRDSPTARLFRGVKNRQLRRQGTTPHEARAFDEVLERIFMDLKREGPLRSSGGTGGGSDVYGAQYMAGTNLYRAGRRAAAHGGGDRMEMEMDDALLVEVDSLKEEMSAIQTDAEMVEWAHNTIFKPKEIEDGHPVYIRAYPYILAHLLRVVWTNFNNPHLALALFRHAQTLSLESYLSGCLTGAYNEVIRVRWNSFRDIEGVEQATREMDANGVAWDKLTRSYVERVCNEMSRSAVDQPKWGGEDGEPFSQKAMASLTRLEGRVQKDIEREQIISKEKMLERVKKERDPYVTVGSLGRRENDYRRRATG